MTDNIEKTPTRGKGRPKGTPKKTKGFRGTTKNIIKNSPTALNDENEPIGLVNIRNDCFCHNLTIVSDGRYLDLPDLADQRTKNYK